MAGKFNLNKGDSVYKYTLLKNIGGDNFGEVWLAHDDAVYQNFAIKLLDATKTSIIDELHEARIGHRMAHANLVKVHGAEVIEYKGKDIVVLAMDYFSNGYRMQQSLCR